LAFKAMEMGGMAPTILNAANEIAVNMFLTGVIKFTHIPEIINYALDNYENSGDITFDKIFETDKNVRNTLDIKNIKL
jgi:1-deoxy-D-xylulose-5-phosphate reductoisomerase